MKERMSVFSRSIFLFAMSGTLLYALWYLAMGFQRLAAEELAASLIFLICHFLAVKRESRSSTYLGIAAILYLCFRSLISFGWGYNIQVFILIMIPMIIASESVLTGRKTLISLFLIAVYFILRYITSKQSPHHILPSPWNSVLPEVNLLLAIGVVSYSFLRYRRAFQRSEVFLKDANSSIMKMANIDMLTQIYNRRAIERSLQLCIANVSADESAYIVGLIDIDDFKKINDSYGHLRGDEVLQELCRRINGSLRGHDFFGRWGGEEFLIILKEGSLKQGVETFNRLRKLIDSRSFTGSDGSEIKVSITIGAAPVYPDSTVESLYSEADKYLYIGKNGGKNRVTSSIS